MRIFILSTVGMLFLTRSAIAAPAIGDYAQYSVSVYVNGQSIPSTQELELTGFNSATQQFEQTITNTPPVGRPQIQKVWIPAQNLQSGLGYLPTSSGCPSPEISANLTVPAGTFSVCTVSGSPSGPNRVVSYANVPFGAVKIQIKTGNSTTMFLLKSYRFGTIQGN